MTIICILMNANDTLVHLALFMQQYITNYHSAESKENQLNRPSLFNDMGLFIDNNTHLHLLHTHPPAPIPLCLFYFGQGG